MLGFQKIAGAVSSGLLVIGMASQASAAAEVCITDQAKQALSACPNSGPKELKGGGGKTPQVSFRGVAPQADPKKATDNKPKNPDFGQGAAQRDERTNRLKARQKALLVTEIQGLENLFRNTSKNAQDRPQLARRLAEDYVELEAAAFREKTEAEMKRDGFKKSNPAAAGQQQTVANQADAIMKKARLKAIENYSLLVSDYPNYPALDEVLYYLAYEYEQASDLSNARRVYYDLIKKRPDSKYVPNAYLAFGELFFNEAQGDPSKWDLARDAYQEVIKYPVEKGNKVYGYAWYKLGYVYWNKGEYQNALNAFKKTIDFGTQNSQLPNAAKLAESARRDIIPVYAMQGNPRAAYGFFHPLSGDQGGNDKTYKMMDDLGTNYLDTGHYPEAIELYKDLMNRDGSGSRTCLYQAHITEAVMAMKSNNKEAIRSELEQQIKVYNAYKAGQHTADEIHECSSKTASMVTETAMAWHIEAVGSNNQRGTGDTKTMGFSAALYQRVVDTWNKAEFATVTFPRLVKEDWPTIFKIKYNMADLLYFQKDWAKCGPAFDSVVEEDPTGPDAGEAAYAAVLCYQSIYEQNHPKDSAKKGSGNLPTGERKTTEAQKKAEEIEKLKPKALTDGQKGMIQAFNRYVCYIKPTTKEGTDQLVEVKYARARTYFEAQHWEEAAAAFREIAMNHPEAEVGVYAAQLYLESINVLGTTASPQRPACFTDDMTADVPKFIELYCTGDKATKNAEQCTSLNKVQVNLKRVGGEKLVEAAGTQQGAQALESYEKAGTLYFDMFKKYCQEPVAASQQPQADRCDEIAYNSARAFQAARLLAKAIAARGALINFDAQTKGNSPLAKKAIYEIGGNFQAIAVYEKAAEYFEKFAASSDPPPEKADSALSDAVLLRLGLGGEENEKKAIDDAAMFRKKFGAAKPAQTAAIAFAIGAHYAEKEEWEKAKATLSGSMSIIDKAAPDIQAQAHATLGRAYAKSKGGDRQSKAEYAKVRALWPANPDDAMAKLKAAYVGEDEGQTVRRMAKGLNAVGEAYFEAAEDAKSKDVDSLKFPAYKGSGSKEEVLKHINTKVKDWYEKKAKAIEKVEAEYKKIVDLKADNSAAPSAPPRWVIAAGSRVGLMWGTFVDDFRAAPIPVAWKTDPEIRGVYYDALDGASEPFKSKKAKPALVTCLTYSVKYQYFDEYSRSCEVWLAKNYKAEYHVVDELRGAPTLANSGLDEKSPPLLIGGTFWRPANTGGPDKIADDEASKQDPKSGNKKPPAKKK